MLYYSYKLLQINQAVTYTVVRGTKSVRRRLDIDIFYTVMLALGLVVSFTNC